MKLLAVCQADEPGGAELGLLRLLRRLSARGWEITLTTPSGGSLSRAGFAWMPLDVGGLGAGEGARAVASWPRARLLGRKHDVVYLNGTVTGRLLPALRNMHTVLHVHDVVRRVPRHWHGASVVLADSQAVADQLDGLDAKVVYCPVELDPPDVAAPWIDGDGPVVGFVGRIEPRKGVLWSRRRRRSGPAARASSSSAATPTSPTRATSRRCARRARSSTPAGSTTRRG